MYLKTHSIPIIIKLLAVFLIIVVPLYITSLMINIQGEENVREEIVMSMSSQLRHYIDGMELELQRIISLQSEYVTEVELLSLCNELKHNAGVRHINIEMDIQSKLKLLKNFSPYITDVKVLIPAISKVISKENVHIVQSDEELNTYLNNNSVLSQVPIGCQGERLYINAPYPMYYKTTAEDQYEIVLQIELSKEVIAAQINSFVHYLNGAAIMRSRDQNWSIVYENDVVGADILKELSRDAKDEKNQSQKVGTKRIDQLNYIEMRDNAKLLNAEIITYFPENFIIGKLQKYKNIFWVVSGLSVLLLLVASVWIYYLFVRPLDRLTEAFKGMERGNLKTTLEHNRRDDFGYLYTSFNSMAGKLNHLIQQVYEQKIHAQRAELKQLQYQINPHFLYNSLFLIHLMANAKDYKNIALLSNHLSQYYQYITKGNINQIRLEEEIQHARNYIEIQTMRFRNRIEVEFKEVSEEVKEFIVPRLIIQPLIENAYEHGLKKAEEGAKIRIQMKRIGGYLEISVEDSGPYINDQNFSMLQNMLDQEYRDESMINATGIFNIHRRLKIMYGEKSGLLVEKSELGGLKVVLRIDMEAEKECIDC